MGLTYNEHLRPVTNLDNNTLDDILTNEKGPKISLNTQKVFTKRKSSYQPDKSKAQSVVS